VFYSASMSSEMSAPGATSASNRLKRLYVALPTAEFRSLAEVADRESRTPDQQATHIVRAWLLRRARINKAADDGRAA
jgi:hypothetical protein